MNARVYLLLDILEGKAAYAIQTLRNAEGVVAADVLAGHPDIIVILEAPDRQKLVDLLMPVLHSLENITEDLHLLMNREDSPAFCFFGVKSTELYSELAMN